MDRSSQGAVYVGFAALGLIWGSCFIFTKWAAVSISAEQIAFLRIVFGFVPLLIVALALRELRWRDLRHAHHFLIMSVLATAFYYLAFAKGTVLLQSSVAGMLSGAIPIFTFLAALAFLREEPINRLTVLGTLLGFLGVFVIARPWSADLGSANPMGVFWLITGSFSGGASFVYAKKFISPLRLSPLALTTYQIGFASLILLVTTDLTGMSAIFHDMRATVGLILGLGVLGTGMAYILYYWVVDRLGAIAASGVMYVPPIVAVAIGAALGEPVQLIDLMAMATILAGVAILQLGRTRRPILSELALPNTSSK